MTMRRYVWLIFGCGIVAMAALFGVMRFMDPYYYYGSGDRPRINATRYGAVDYPEMAKVYSVEWFKPRAVIMGSSRAQIGLDPEHRAFAHHPVYSLAYPGSSMRRTLALFQHAVANNDIRQVVLTVDMFVFRANSAGDSEFVRLSVLPDGSKPDLVKHWRARLLDFWRNSFSSAAIKQASADLLTNTGAFDLRQMRWIMRRDGHNELRNAHNFDYEAIFGAVEASYSKDYLTGEFCLSLKPGESSLGDLGTLVKRAREIGIDLRIAISPVHVSLVEVIDRSGLWRTWEAWKREIVRLAEIESGGSTPVFDFSGYNGVTTEAVPIGAVAVQMNNYWDPSHYKRDIGNRVLDVVLGNQDSSDSGFGVRLTSANVETHLEAIRKDQASWRERNPAQIARNKGAKPDKLPKRNCRNGPAID